MDLFDIVISGKIRKEGGDVSVDALSVTENGTYTAEEGHAYSPVTVNVSGGGGGSPYTLIGSFECTVSIGTSTTETTIGEFSIPVDEFPDKTIIVITRLKGGAQNDHFFAGVVWLPKRMSSSTSLYGYTNIRYDSNGALKIDTQTGTSKRGVYASTYSYRTIPSSQLTVKILAKYNATSSFAVDGDYITEVYAVDYLPNLNL